MILIWQFSDLSTLVLVKQSTINIVLFTKLNIRHFAFMFHSPKLNVLQIYHVASYVYGMYLCSYRAALQAHSLISCI